MNEQFTYPSNARVTLYNDFIEPIKNGLYHVEQISLPVDLFDYVTIQLIQEKHILIRCEDDHIPENEKNICYKAANKVLDLAQSYAGGVCITIRKNIPTSSGLGGGASNASIVLQNLSVLLGVKLDWDMLREESIAIGRDCHFFLYNRPALVWEVGGEKITPLLLSNDNFYICIINPNLPFLPEKSKFIMGRIAQGSKKQCQLETIYNLLILDDCSRLCDNLYNPITQDIVPEYEKVFVIQEEIYKTLTVKPCLTGVGPFLILPINKKKYIGQLKKFSIKCDLQYSIHRVII